MAHFGLQEPSSARMESQVNHMINRQDYCPIGGEPCQSMCEQKCTVRKPLTDEQLAQIIASIAKGAYRQPILFAVALGRAIERAHGITGD